MGVRVGVDIGGTFTDAVLVDEVSGRVWVAKSLTTPKDRTVGVCEAVVEGLRLAGRKPADVSLFAHGSTVGLNALLERRGAVTALLATKGFTDVLEIGRQTRRDLYDLFVTRPAPLVPRHLRKGIEERVDARGQVLRPLSTSQAEREILPLREERIESVAVCFLHSYVNPEHEKAVRDILVRLLPGTYVALSSEVLPEFREFERMSTTSVTAYLGPTLKKYLSHLAEALVSLGVRAAPRVMQSNMGFATPEQVVRSPAKNVLSGPSAGVAGAAYVAGQAGFKNIISLDMGGTSADICLITGGTPAFTTAGEIGGIPIRHAMVDAIEIGAGGGSIAWLDETGRLKVGPQSAGSDPGPVCYGRGGEEVTVTDAHLLLGHLGPRSIFKDRELDVEKTRRIAERTIAKALGVDVETAAKSILKLATSNMERAIRQVSVERGIDPGDYTLLPFGGAGPMHGCELARNLGLQAVFVPRFPGVLSAVGLLVVDCRTDLVRTHILDVSEPSAAEQIERVARALDEEAKAWFEDASIPAKDRRCIRSVDMRYVHQNYEISVPLPDPMSIPALCDAFHALHETRYGYCAPSDAMQVVNIRVAAVGVMPKPASDGGDSTSPRLGVKDALLEHRPAVIEDARVPRCPIYDRERLPLGANLRGPAVIEQYGATTVLPTGTSCAVDSLGNLVIRSES